MEPLTKRLTIEPLALNKLLASLENLKTGGGRIPPYPDPVLTNTLIYALLHQLTGYEKDDRLRGQVQREIHQNFSSFMKE